MAKPPNAMLSLGSFIGNDSTTTASIGRLANMRRSTFSSWAAPKPRCPAFRERGADSVAPQRPLRRSCERIIFVDAESFGERVADEEHAAIVGSPLPVRNPYSS
jgi:hypothetical protein